MLGDFGGSSTIMLGDAMRCDYAWKEQERFDNVSPEKEKNQGKQGAEKEKQIGVDERAIAGVGGEAQAPAKLV
jgi:hypothetical protein